MEQNYSLQQNQEVDDWDINLTEEDFQTIDAICQASTTSISFPPIKTPHVSDNSNRRKLPDSLFICQKEGSISHSINPCRKNRYNPYNSQGKVTMRYPEISFKGNITYSRTAREAEKAAEELLTFVQSKKQDDGQVVLGFDIEWKPTFKRGVPPGKAAVMQICGNSNHCYVIQIIHSGITKKLQSLLEDPAVVKVGVCIANDAYKLLQDYNILVKSVEDLSDLANQNLGGPPRKWSLALLTETVVCKQLPKPSKIRLGNWEAKILSKEQLQYAAGDAFVSWYLYQVLQSLPQPVNGNTEAIEAGSSN
ncbi:hypothetical protein LIER_25353 [Lithospermum erythrorhizon]|uniref:3'-5' exonuclease n=1 Tax=Lithospermum erythrorhizon TaxID=34254 RepID=A0AAV3R6J3_LITER